MADPSNNVELQKGLVLGGKYRLEREIGRGAMGSVWSAVHETLHQRVAVKVISREHADSDDLRRRFDTEARAAAKLRSRFVVSVSDNGETEGGLPYIVMEYLEGECLEDRIARLGRLPLSEVTRILRHLTRALSKAHARGIVHRDLKPANIFISQSEDEDHGDDWIAKVLDFGVAKMDDYGDRSTTKTGTVLGTPLFMAPEQVRGASGVDGRADLYSLGMVVYNMLTGTFAFEGQSFGDLLVSICTDPLPELSGEASDIPPSLDTWFKRACARNPDERYQTAEQFLAGFLAAIGEEGLASGRISDVVSSTPQKAPRPPAPLAETFAAQGTANAGTPASAATIVAPSPLRESTGMGASAVTVHEPPRQGTLRLWLGLAAAAAAGVGLLFVLTPPPTTGLDELAGGETAAPAAPPEPIPAPVVEVLPNDVTSAPLSTANTSVSDEALGTKPAAKEPPVRAALATPQPAPRNRPRPPPKQRPPITSTPHPSAATPPPPSPSNQPPDLGF